MNIFHFKKNKCSDCDGLQVHVEVQECVANVSLNKIALRAYITIFNSKMNEYSSYFNLS